MHRSYFDPTQPEEQLTVEFWENVQLAAIAEWMLEQMELGRIAPPGMFRAA